MLKIYVVLREAHYTSIVGVYTTRSKAIAAIVANIKETNPALDAEDLATYNQWAWSQNFEVLREAYGDCHGVYFNLLERDLT